MPMCTQATYLRIIHRNHTVKIGFPLKSASLRHLDFSAAQSTSCLISFKGCYYPNLKVLRLARVDESTSIDFPCFPALKEFSIERSSNRLVLDFSQHPIPLEHLILGDFTGELKTSSFSIGKLEISKKSLKSLSVCAALRLVRNLVYSCFDLSGIELLGAQLSDQPAYHIASDTLEGLDIICADKDVEAVFGPCPSLERFTLWQLNVSLPDEVFSYLRVLDLACCSFSLNVQFKWLHTLHLCTGLLKENCQLQAPRLRTLIIDSVKNASKLVLLKSFIPLLREFTFRLGIETLDGSDAHPIEYFPFIDPDGIIPCDGFVDSVEFPGSVSLKQPCQGSSCPCLKHDPPSFAV